MRVAVLCNWTTYYLVPNNSVNEYGIPPLICDSYFLCGNVHYRIIPYANTDPRGGVVQDIDWDDARDQEKAEGDDCTEN